MLEPFYEYIAKYFPTLNSWFVFFVVLIVGLYIFWKECTRTGKNNSSIFDIFIVSTVFGSIVGRISYIITEWGDFSRYIWYWLPYEKYGDQVFFFRLLPWRFLRFWDWGNDTFAMFVGVAVISTLFVIFVKRWKWSHLFPAIFYSVFAMLGLSIFFSGCNVDNREWIEQGVFMLVIVFFTFFIRYLLYKKSSPKIAKVLLNFEVISILVSVLYISYAYISSDMILMEKIDLVVFVSWSLLGLLFHVIDSNRASVVIEKVSSVRPVSLSDINQQIRLPK